MATRTSDNASIANRTAIALASGYDMYEPLAPLLFNDEMPTRKDEIFSIHAHDGAFSEVAEDANFPSVDIVEVGSKTLSQRTFKKKLVISQLMKRFDSEGKIMKEAMRIGYDMRLSQDQLAADVLNNGFSATTVWDGLALFSDAHLIGATGFTQDNLETGALSDTVLNAEIISLRALKTHRNTKMPLPPRTLLVPIQLEKKARELIESMGAPESANNNTNTHRSRGIQIVVWELLSSATAHFLLSDKLFHNLTRLVAIAPLIEVRGRIYTESGSEEVRAEYATQCGAPDYLGVVGNQGT